MPIPIYCEGCQRHYKAPDRCAGQTIQCKSCGTQIEVPAPGPDADQAELVEAEEILHEPPPAKKPAPPASARKPTAPARPAAKPPHTPSSQAAAPSPPHSPHAAHRHRKKTGLPTFIILLVLLGLAGAAGLVTYLCLPKDDSGRLTRAVEPAKSPVSLAKAPPPPAVRAAAASSQPATPPDASAPPKTAAAPASRPALTPVAGWTPLSDPCTRIDLASHELPALPRLMCGLLASSAPDSPVVLYSRRTNLSENSADGERELRVYHLLDDKSVQCITVRNLPRLEGRLSPDGLHYAYLGQKDGQAGLLLQSLEKEDDLKFQAMPEARWFDFASAGRLVISRPAKNLITVWDYVSGQPADVAAAPAGAAPAGAVSGTGKYLALAGPPAGGQVQVHLYDLGTSKPAGRLNAPMPDAQAATEGVAFSAEGTLLGVLLRSGARRHLACWDLAAGRLTWQHSYETRIASPAQCRPALQFLPREAGLLIQGREVLLLGQAEPARILPAPDKAGSVIPDGSRIFASGLVLSAWSDPAKILDGVTVSYDDVIDSPPPP